MRVEQADTDYHISLTESDLRKTCSRTKVPWSIFPQHPPLSAPYTDSSGKPSEAELVATNDYNILHSPQAHDLIAVGFDQFGLFAHVFTNLLVDLHEGKKGFLVTRYDGHEAKIWIRQDEGQP